MTPDTSHFDRAVAAHDDTLRSAGLEIWVGTEPTFTDRHSSEPQWSGEALGDAKRQRAEELLVVMARGNPGCAVLRSVGRRYGGESMARWSYGILRRRDRRAVWTGPPDPLVCEGPLAPPDLAALARHFVELARQAGHAVLQPAATVPGELRLLLSDPAAAPLALDDPRLQRPPQDELENDSNEALDELAPAGHYLFVLWPAASHGRPVARVELPALGTPARCLELLALLGRAARLADLPALVLAGFPPPVDASLAYSTVTPDPGVLEVNMAPYPCVADLLSRTRTLFAATEALGLSRYRLWFNGDVGDSGGGGHITLGGPTPQDSPFLRWPQLLPGLVRYTNRHPCLSYLFSHDFVGAGGQAARTDERDREHFDELGVALMLLSRHPAPEPEFIWRSLAPFMTDSSGNSHRAELNIEKLWNPELPERGCLGLVEFRALRMADSAERVAALAALLRSVCARLALQRCEDDLVDWGAELHERFALPFYQRLDLRQVLAELAEAGFGLPAPLEDELLRSPANLLGQVAVDGAELTLRRALEFWPLMGDASSQASGTSRLIDPSNGRLELCLRPAPGAAPEDLAGWHLAVQGQELPLRSEQDEAGPARLFAIRFRRFVAAAGMHPGLPAQGPIELLLWHERSAVAQRITVHEWRPDGAAYDGLPIDLDDAAGRRQARVVCETLQHWRSVPAPATALSPYCLDLRRLAQPPRQP